jgi:uncharacterized protein (DUF1499 family)
MLGSDRIATVTPPRQRPTPASTSSQPCCAPSPGLQDHRRSSTISHTAACSQPCCASTNSHPTRHRPTPVSTSSQPCCAPSPGLQDHRRSSTISQPCCASTSSHPTRHRPTPVSTSSQHCCASTTLQETTKATPNTGKHQQQPTLLRTQPRPA